MTELDPKALEAAQLNGRYMARVQAADVTASDLALIDKIVLEGVRLYLAASQQQGLEIKGLVWRDEPNADEVWAVVAIGLGCRYVTFPKASDVAQIGIQCARLVPREDGGEDLTILGYSKTLDDAKAAAQADYEARIRTALAPSVGAEEPTLDALRHDCAKAGPCSDMHDGCSCSDAELLKRAPSPHKGEPAIWVSSKQMPKLVTGGYVAARDGPEGNFDTPLYAQAPIPKGMVLMPDELNGEMWLAGRRVFEDEAERFRATTTTAMAMAIADRAPEKIFSAIIAAATPAPQAEPGAGE